MIYYYPDPINLTAVFGAVFGIYLVYNLEGLARSAVMFIKGLVR